MENRQIFMFFADVVALAAQHFGQSPQASSAEPAPPEDAGRPTTVATPPTGARTAEMEREQILLGAFASELGSVLDEDEDADDEIAGVERPRQTPRGRGAPATATRAAIDKLVAELENLNRELSAERAVNRRLRDELAGRPPAVAYDRLSQTMGVDSGHAVRTEQELLAGGNVDRLTVAELLKCAVLTMNRVPRAVGHDSPADVPLRDLADLSAFTSTTNRSGRGRDIEAELTIPFSQMVCGGTTPLQVEVDGESRAIEIAVPAGIADGTTLTLPAQGGAGDPPGDLLVRVRVIPALTFARDGNNITMCVPVPPEALARKKLSVEAPTGALTVSFTPEHLGHTLRCKGKGIAPEGQEAGDLLLTLDPSPILAASIDQFPSPAAAFAALRSLCPAARSHLTNLANWARDAADQRDIREMLWALAVAHERGLRAPLSGFAAQLVGELVKHASLRPSDSRRNRRGHVFTWLRGKSPLLTRERTPRSPNLVWTVHFERLGDEAAWSRVGLETAATT